MIVADIVKELDAEIARLQQVRRLLSNESSLIGNGVAAVSQATSPNSAGSKKKLTLRREARQRIAEARHRRWDAAKKQAE